MSFYSLLACSISADESVDSLMRVHLQVIVFFSPAAFKILPLLLTFDYFNIMNRNRDTNVENKHMDTKRRKRRRDELGDWDLHIYTNM